MRHDGWFRETRLAPPAGPCSWCLHAPEYSLEYTSLDEYDQRGKKEDGEKTVLISEVQKV